MKIKNIIFYHKISIPVTAACCALCLGMLAFPTVAQAQDDESGSEIEATVRKAVVAKKKDYPTNHQGSCVLSSAAMLPCRCAGQCVGIEGYSVLTNDNGEYELKVPVFVNAVMVTNPSTNAFRWDLARMSNSKTSRSIPKTSHRLSRRGKPA
jgi:hypothetical protein